MREVLRFTFSCGEMGTCRRVGVGWGQLGVHEHRSYKRKREAGQQREQQPPLDSTQRAGSRNRDFGGC